VVLRSVSSNEVLASFIVRFNVTAPVLSPAAMDGGGWRTRLYLVNPAPVPAKATLTFWTATNTPDGSGAAWAVKLAGKGFVTRLENELIPAGGLRVIETEGTQNHLQYGWVEMQADGPVSMYSVLSEAKTVSKWLPVDATVPILNSYRDHLMIPFDNLNGGTVSVSLANVDGDPITVEVTVLNENGAEIAREGRFTLDGREGKTIMAAEQWTSTAGRRGLLSFRYDGGRLLAIGLRALGKSFHAYPAIACNEIGLDRGLPSVSVGGAWESTAYFANTTSQDQFGLLRLWSDKSRLADVPLSDESAPVVPANGILTWQAPYKGKSQPAGGWLETQFSKQVSGFMLLRQSYAEAALAVPVVENYESVLVGQHGLLGRTAIPYDNRQSYSTRIVLVNLSDIATDIQPVAYDLLGRYPRFLDAFRVPARGQLIVDAATYGEPSTPQGIIQFTSRQGVPLTGAGLRFGDGALTILPAYEQ
ncbi:MAG: hypothetical protein OEW16_09550, partial [Gammaproteobacteria bacterium]|nr:hypothetical protein [Gammaproteobacteria bacterium]